MFKKKNRIVEIHKYRVIEEIDEYYPETNKKLIRPKINYVKVFFNIVLTLLFDALVTWFVVSQILVPEYVKQAKISYYIILFIILLVLYLIIRSKSIVIFIIRLYQRYGPYEVRCMCLFVPNCSEYMILAIEKYGLIKGIKKGIDRLRRCHAPNFGVDYP